MTVSNNAEEAFSYLRKAFGDDYVQKNPISALRFAGDWINAAATDDISNAIHGLQDVLFAMTPAQTPD